MCAGSWGLHEAPGGTLVARSATVPTGTDRPPSPTVSLADLTVTPPSGTRWGHMGRDRRRTSENHSRKEPCQDEPTLWTLG